MQVDKEHEYFTPNSTDELIAHSLRCAVKFITQRVITVLTVIILLLWRRDGDVILINKRCTSLPPVQALLCFASKYGLSGDGRHGWDHAAIVYREPKTNVPMLLEGGPKGVSLRTFEERLMQGTDHQEVLLLPLRGADGQAQSDKHQKLAIFVKVHGNLDNLVTASCYSAHRERDRIALIHRNSGLLALPTAMMVLERAVQTHGPCIAICAPLCG